MDMGTFLPPRLQNVVGELETQRLQRKEQCKIVHNEVLVETCPGP